MGIAIAQRAIDDDQREQSTTTKSENPRVVPWVVGSTRCSKNPKKIFSQLLVPIGARKKPGFNYALRRIVTAEHVV